MKVKKVEILTFNHTDYKWRTLINSQFTFIGQTIWKRRPFFMSFLTDKGLLTVYPTTGNLYKKAKKKTP
jgi:hypothetical protein